MIVTDVHGDALPVDALQRRAASVMKLFRLEMERYCCASILVLRSEPIRAAVAAACAEADTRHRVIFTTSLCEAAETAERELGAAGLAIHAKARELLVSMQRETLDRIA
ncbi:MAG: hypothetical protein H5U40_07705 [Polyangiaceae bacterium]|nr:hypothetical protein [Polyangiaceae bacterium]